jgi:F0F1-type ATP synthase assembly protein I
LKPSKKSLPDPGTSLRNSLGRAAPYLGVGMQLAVSMVAYVAIGYFADRWLGTQPWLLVAGAVVGMIAFFVQLYRLVGQMNDDTKADLAERHSHDDASL